MYNLAFHSRELVMLTLDSLANGDWKHLTREAYKEWDKIMPEYFQAL